MTDKKIQQEIREQLADQEHERWSSWMRYLYSTSPLLASGAREIPASYVKHWQRQMDTRYSRLSEKEKDSDRKEADNTLALVQAELDAKDTIIAEGREIVEAHVKDLWGASRLLSNFELNDRKPFMRTANELATAARELYAWWT